MTPVLRYAFVCLLGLLPTLASTANAQTQSNATQLVEEGDAAYAAFDNKEALLHYEQAYRSDTTNFDVLLKMSRTSYDWGLDLIAQDQEEQATQIFESSILYAQSLVRQYPDSAQAHFLLAATMGNLALFKGGREKIWLGRMVEQHSNKAISLDPSLAYPYVSLGIYYRELSRLSWLERTLAKVFFGRLPASTFEQAVELLETALELRPNFPFLHFELAMTYMMQKQKEKAISHLQTLIELSPETTQDARNQDYAERLVKEWQSDQD